MADDTESEDLLEASLLAELDLSALAPGLHSAMLLGGLDILCDEDKI